MPEVWTIAITVYDPQGRPAAVTHGGLDGKLVQVLEAELRPGYIADEVVTYLLATFAELHRQLRGGVDAQRYSQPEAVR